MTKNKEAIIIVDMINDFVYGKFGGEGARNIIENMKHFLNEAESIDIPIFFPKDTHEKSDTELEVWGEHAMKSDTGSEIIDDLKDINAVKIEKNHFDAFFETDLGSNLNDKGIDKVILGGVSTDICVQNTAAGAFFRGYDIVVLEDCTAAISEDKHETALEYMNNIYGAEIKNSKDVIQDWKNK